MKRRPVISRSGKPRVAGDGRWPQPDDVTAAFVTLHEHDEPPMKQRLAARWTGFYGRHQGPLLVAISVATTLALVGLYQLAQPSAQRLTQPQLNAAVNFALDERPRPPSVASVAYAKIIGSVVEVNGFDPSGDKPGDKPSQGATEDGPLPPDLRSSSKKDDGVDGDFHERFSAVGTGVVIDEKGTILTNLHVAAAAPRLRVMFADGTLSDALVVGVRPEHDLAVLRPDVLPDDLQPATLASTANLRPGDDVLAVGFPFGIGPSATAGVVSGLKRQFGGEDGGRALGNLIQFDAAANPGNSGGPLVNADGEVVGIVTAIVNPSGVRTFAGIGFAVPIENAMGGLGESPL